MNVRETLKLRKPPVAIAFLDTPPAGVPRWVDGEKPAGCVFWREAQEGRTFYTEPRDHYNCAVGAYTHSIPLPPDRQAELQSTVTFMVESSYIRMDDVEGIPTLAGSPRVVAYGPAESAPFDPSAVIVAATPVQAMLLFEAAARAGAAGSVQSLGRPACAALPLATSSGGACISLGCRGNRTFTGLPDDEMYVVVAGSRWPAVVQQVVTIVQANETMLAFYQQHQQRFAPA